MLDNNSVPELQQVDLSNFFHLSVSDERIFNYLKSDSIDGFIKCVDNRLKNFNSTVPKLFGYTNAAQLLNKPLHSLFDDFAEYQHLMMDFEKQGTFLDQEVNLKTKEGKNFIGYLSLIKVKSEDNISNLYCSIRGESYRGLNVSKYSVLQNALLNISSEYMNAQTDEIDSVINLTLKQVGELISVDRIIIHFYDFNRNECTTINEWFKKGLKPAIGNRGLTTLDSIRDLLTVHQKGECLYFYDVAEIPNEFMRKALLSFKIKSFLTIPMKVKGSCIGFIEINTVNNSKTFDKNIRSCLKLFANLTANVISRCIQGKKLNQLVEQTTIQNKRLKEFSFITSHNIRSSAANLLVISDFISQYPTNLKYIRMMQSSVTKLNSSIKDANDLLTLGDEFEMNELKKCNISAAMKKVLKWHKITINSKEAIIINQLPIRLQIFGIPNYIDNILNQLIANALRFGINESSKKIFIDYINHKEKATIRIRDFGNGIDLKKNSSKLFQIGSRMHTNSCETMGMGLFLAKFQIEALGGKIELNSEINHGTSVEITFLKK